MRKLPLFGNFDLPLQEQDFADLGFQGSLGVASAATLEIVEQLAVFVDGSR